MPEELLDTEHPGKLTHPTLEAIEWWEARRTTYNLVVLGTELLMIGIFWKGAHHFGVGGVIAWLVLYTIAANVCFCVGWGMSALIHHYQLTFLQALEGARTVLFALGLLFSVALTVAWFSMALTYPHLFFI